MRSVIGWLELDKTFEELALIAASEGRRQEQINIATGERVAAAIRQPGGEQAVQLKVAERAVDAYGRLASEAKTTLVVPSNMTEVSRLITSAMQMIQTGNRT